MKKINLLVILFVPLASFDKSDNKSRLIFEEEKGMRSSFCMYSDGRFYETRPAGCVEQGFASGKWENINDTIILNYQTANVFTFEVIKSPSAKNRNQIIRVIDLYNQPVRFENVCCDTTCQNLYNPGILEIEKGKSIFYNAPVFELKSQENEFINCSADTITYKWQCNRESIESINGGTLFIIPEQGKKKIILKNKRFIELPE